MKFYKKRTLHYIKQHKTKDNDPHYLKRYLLIS